MSHRLSVLSWWPFSGYSGPKSVSGISLSISILHFFVRFLLFYFATLIPWFFIHSYYETILWFFTIKASWFFGQAHFSEPYINNGEYLCSLGKDYTYRYIFTRSITLNIFITIPLLLSTSGISLLNRVQMTLISLVFLFPIQALFLLITLYTKVYQNYPLWLQKGIITEQIITYNLYKVEIFSWLTHFFYKFLNLPLSVGIWIGLVSYYKRYEKQHWIRKLF